jgi:hypothetical protein
MRDVGQPTEFPLERVNAPAGARAQELQRDRRTGVQVDDLIDRTTCTVAELPNELESAEPRGGVRRAEESREHELFQQLGLHFPASFGVAERAEHAGKLAARLEPRQAQGLALARLEE